MIKVNVFVADKKLHLKQKEVIRIEIPGYYCLQMKDQNQVENKGKLSEKIYDSMQAKEIMRKFRIQSYTTIILVENRQEEPARELVPGISHGLHWA